LFAQATGQPLDLPERLKRERQRKAKAIAAHQAMWDEVVRKMVMALDAGEIETISDAVDDALDEIRWAIEAIRKR
jgi:hypothetical protein